MAGHDRLTEDGKKFYAEIEKLKKLQVRIGYQNDGTLSKQRGSDGNIEDSEVNLIDVVMFNELGTSNMPSRPFMRQSVDTNADRITSFCKSELTKLVNGGTAKKVLDDIGVMQKGLVQEIFVKGDFVPNAPSTVKKKRSERPLIDTGQMRQSVHYVIVEKKKDGE